MSLHYRLRGLPCVFCGRPVYRLDVYEDCVRTVHEPGYSPPCDYRRRAPELRTGAVEPFNPPAPPAPVRTHPGWWQRPWGGSA